MISAAHRDRVLSYINQGVAEGPRSLLDGQDARVEGYPKRQLGGAYGLRRRAARDGDRDRGDLRAGRVRLMRANDLDEVIVIANRSEYGNAASIYTSRGRAARAVPAPRRRRDGRREHRRRGAHGLLSFGGQKGSFFGDLKAHGPMAIDFYTERKIVITRWF